MDKNEAEKALDKLYNCVKTADRVALRMVATPAPSFRLNFAIVAGGHDTVRNIMFERQSLDGAVQLCVPAYGIKAVSTLGEAGVSPAFVTTVPVSDNGKIRRIFRGILQLIVRELESREHAHNKAIGAANTMLGNLTVTNELRELVKKYKPAEAKRESEQTAASPADASADATWHALVARADEVRQEALRTGLPVFGAVQDSLYHGDFPAGKRESLCGDEMACIKEWAERITAGRGFKSDTFYDFTGITTGRINAGSVHLAQMQVYQTAEMAEWHRRMIIAGMGISESRVGPAFSMGAKVDRHRWGDGIADAFMRETLTSPPRGSDKSIRLGQHIHDEIEFTIEVAKAAPPTNRTDSDIRGGRTGSGNRARRLIAKQNVEFTIGMEMFDWCYVLDMRAAGNKEEVAQLVDIDGYTLTFEFRKTLDGKRTTRQLSYDTLGNMRGQVQKIVGDPFRTDNSVFTKRLGVDLPYED